MIEGNMENCLPEETLSPKLKAHVYLNQVHNLHFYSTFQKKYKDTDAAIFCQNCIFFLSFSFYMFTQILFQFLHFKFA